MLAPILAEPDAYREVRAVNDRSAERFDTGGLALPPSRRFAIHAGLSEAGRPTPSLRIGEGDIMRRALWPIRSRSRRMLKRRLRRVRAFHPALLRERARLAADASADETAFD
ncbi:hypothetical protein MBUL_00752 [Methylobacterium bullatum]|uniref:Uncharacterized protein n=1 Tax=Methylobacterium bullatum TaxID=570505 RepID=A0A679IY90_9HYPH|nr:hypothetical protein MBUL_00752 [Methylobacterium bullatum]